MAITLNLDADALEAFGGDETTAQGRLEAHIKQITVEHIVQKAREDSEAEIETARNAMDTAIADYKAVSVKRNKAIDDAYTEAAIKAGLNIAADESVTITSETIQ